MTSGWVAAFVTLWFVALLSLVLMLGMLRRISPVLEEVQSWLRDGGFMLGPNQGLTRGAEVPSFTALDEMGEPLRSEQLWGEPAVFLFIEPGCGPCEQLAEGLQAIDGAAKDAILIVTDNTEKGRSLGLKTGAKVLLQSGRRVSTAFRTSITPHAFSIDADGRVVDRRVPGSVDDLLQLAEVSRGGDGSQLGRALSTE